MYVCINVCIDHNVLTCGSPKNKVLWKESTKAVVLKIIWKFPYSFRFVTILYTCLYFVLPVNTWPVYINLKKLFSPGHLVCHKVSRKFGLSQRKKKKKTRQFGTWIQFPNKYIFDYNNNAILLRLSIYSRENSYNKDIKSNAIKEKFTIKKIKVDEKHIRNIEEFFRLLRVIVDLLNFFDMIDHKIIVSSLVLIYIHLLNSIIESINNLFQRIINTTIYLLNS